MTDVISTLTAAEADYLAECEDRIERGLQTFVEVGTALAMIRDNKLYRASYPTFADYCEARWGFSDRRARQIIDAAAIGTIVPVENEGQARELARVPEPDRARVWEAAVEATDGKPTAAAIRAVTAPSSPSPAARPAAQPEEANGRLPRPGSGNPEDVPVGDGGPVDVRPADGAVTPDSEAPAGVPAPAGAGELATGGALFPEPPDDSGLDASLDAAMADTDVRFRRNFSAALARADDVWEFDVDRIAELYAGSYDADLRPWLQEMTRWCEQVSVACRQRRSGLRLVAGGRS